jgi:hypothetical protein
MAIVADFESYPQRNGEVKAVYALAPLRRRAAPLSGAWTP